MSTTAQVPAEMTMEQKLLLASQEAEQVATMFSPVAAQAIAAGIAIEPVISGLVGLIRGIFAHHTKPVPIVQ